MGIGDGIVRMNFVNFCVVGSVLLVGIGGVFVVVVFFCELGELFVVDCGIFLFWILV